MDVSYWRIAPGNPRPVSNHFGRWPVLGFAPRHRRRTRVGPAIQFRMSRDGDRRDEVTIHVRCRRYRVCVRFHKPQLLRTSSRDDLAVRGCAPHLG